ncbi:MAG: pyrroline-5-carboxylate reductase [Alphaproteobacteria bacterium]|nr:pyrroline-5-carboxylate reductase [Alphaproteobacteria bacterium]
MTDFGPMLLIGCGKMGGAMLAGWLESGAAESGVVAVEPNADAMTAFAGDRRVQRVDAISDIPEGFAPETVILAVKPQMMEAALVGLAGRLPRDALILSVAAGKTIAYFQTIFGDRPVVRAMPNTPAAIGRGITAWIADGRTTAAQAARAETLLRAVGETVALDSEEQIDVVTALSGGGPAYVFHLVEAMAAAGEAQGLAPEVAMALARQTVSGAGALLDQSPESAAQLRINVTSPKGTTERALGVLMAEDGFPSLVESAVAAATARSRELAG